MTRRQIWSIVMLAASVVYDLIPADFIPDVPFIGWLDDVLLTSSAALNCLQQFSTESNPMLEKLLKWSKWTCLILAAVIVLLMVLFATAIVSLFQ